MSVTTSNYRRDGGVRLISSLDELDSRILKGQDMNGWWHISDDIYHSSSPLGRSGMLKYLSSPANFRLKDVIKNERAFIVGRAFHEKFSLTDWSNKWFVAPKVDKRTKAGKAEWAEFIEGKDESQILTTEESEMVEGMFKNVDTEPYLVDTLNDDVQYELACFSKEDNVWCKAKLDGWRSYDRKVVEFKTTAASSLEDFKRSFFNFYYDIQAAYYWDRIERGVGVRPRSYVCLGFEKNPPYKVYILELADEVIELGRARYKPLLEQHKICTFENYWPKNAGPDVLLPPNYLLNKYGI